MAFMTVPAAARTFRIDHCYYASDELDIQISQDKCTLEATETNGNYEAILHLSPDIRVTIEYVSSIDGRDHVWKINGQPAWGYEIDREHLYGATLDHKQFVAWHEPD